MPPAERIVAFYIRCGTAEQRREIGTKVVNRRGHPTVEISEVAAVRKHSAGIRHRIDRLRRCLSSR